MKTKVLSLCLALLTGVTMWAYDFKSGDLCYHITNDTQQPYTVEVCYDNLNDNYSGLTSVSIPFQVDFAGLTFNF